MVCIGNMLGFHPDAWWPEAGESSGPPSSGLDQVKDFTWGRTSAPLGSIRSDLTMIEGLDHGTKGGHFSIHTFLSGVRQTDARSMPDGNVTIDQYAAESVVGLTRFPSLTIGSEGGIHGGCRLSWTKTGTRVPPIPGPEQLFHRLFLKSDQGHRRSQFDLHTSILDQVRDETHHYERQLNGSDRVRLDEYLTSVREVEQRIQLRRRWLEIPKPDAPISPPQNRNMVEDLPLLYDLILMALQTDSTRIATLEIGGDFNPRDLGVRGGYHSLSHHGHVEESIEALITLETYQVRQFARFVKKLGETTDEDGALLDSTTVLFGSGMGNANSHTNTNLPVAVAGGRFRRGTLMRFDPRDSHRPPLTNLFVSLLHDFGVETERFATSTGTLRGLA